MQPTGLFRNPAACVMIMIAFAITGVYQFLNLPIALYPNTSQPEVVAGLRLATMGSREFRERYGKETETALLAIEGVEKVEADYSERYVQYTISFRWGISNTKAKEDVRSSIDPIQSQFPKNWDRFWVSFSGQYNSRFFLGMMSERLSDEQMSDVVNNSIKPAVQSIPGLADVWIVDWSTKRVLVTLYPAKLAQYGLTFDNVISKLQQREHDPAAGQVKISGMDSKSVSVSLRFRDLKDIEECVVTNRGSTEIRVKDVAQVLIDHEKPRNLYKSNGQRMLLFGGYVKPDANIKDVADKFISESRRIALQADPDMEVRSLLNPSDFIDSAIDNVIGAVWAAIIITTLITFLFLASFRDTLIICIAIPLSGLGGFILMRAFGIEINLISMGAMALAVGMVVDGATVVLENVVRHLNEVTYPAHVSLFEKIHYAVAEVKVAVAASIITVIIVFLPLPFTSPLSAAILGDLAIVIVCVMVVSMAITIYLIPPMIYFLRNVHSKPDRFKRFYEWAYSFNRGFDRLQNLYLRSLKSLLRNKVLSKRAMVVVLGLFVISMVILFTLVKQEVMAKPETDKVFVHVEEFNKPNLRLDEAEAVIDGFEKLILKEYGNEISDTFSEVTETTGWILITIKNQSQMNSFKEKLENLFKQKKDFKFFVDDWTPTQLEIPNPPVLRVSSIAEADEKQREALRTVVEGISDDELVGRVSSKPSTKKVDAINLLPRPNFFRLISEDRQLSFNASPEAIAGMVLPMVNESNMYDLEFADKTYPFVVRMVPDLVRDEDGLSNIPVRVGSSLIPLKALVEIKNVSTWSGLYTEGGKYKAFVEIWPKLSDTSNRSVLREKLKDKIQKLDGVQSGSLIFEERDQEIRENIMSLLLALIIAVLLIGLVIVFQFGSIPQTMIVLSAIPLGFIGSALSLWIFQSTLGINSLLGALLLSGTAVNNSIIFVDFYNVRKRSGVDRSNEDLIMETAGLRLKPIMITTLTTILGMLPIAFGWGEGATILQPLGISVCGGLWLSTLLTIYVVPILLSRDSRPPSKDKTMALKSVSAVLIAAAVCLPASSLRAQVVLGLDDVLKLAEEASPDLQAAQADVRSAGAATGLTVAKVLPVVAIGRDYSEEPLRYTKDHPIGPKNETIKFGQNYLSIEEKIQNPYRLLNSIRSDRYRSNAAEINLEDQRFRVRKDARVQFYKVLSAQKALANAEKNLELAKADHGIADRRFRGGYIHSADAKRSTIVFRRAEVALAEQQQSLLGEMNALKAMLGKDVAERIELKGELPRNFKYFGLNQKQLNDLIESKASLAMKAAELNEKAERLDLQNSRLNYLPDFSLTATYRRNDPERIERKDVVPRGPTMLLGARWELFSGGKSYFQAEQSIASLDRAKSAVVKAEREFDVTLSNDVKMLDVLRQAFVAQLETVKLMDEIVGASRQRFQSGTADSKQVNDDFTQFLEQEARLLELTIKIINAVSEISRLTGKSELFEQMI